MMNLIYQLNLKNNFHLSLKCIEFSEKKTLMAFCKSLSTNNYSYQIIDESQDIYSQLYKAYLTKVDYVLYISIPVLLPLLFVITNDNYENIKPLIPVYYCLKDNRIIQKVKTKCNQTYTQYFPFHNEEELLNNIINFLKNN